MITRVRLVNTSIVKMFSCLTQAPYFGPIINSLLSCSSSKSVYSLNVTLCHAMVLTFDSLLTILSNLVESQFFWETFTDSCLQSNPNSSSLGINCSTACVPEYHQC